MSAPASRRKRSSSGPTFRATATRQLIVGEENIKTERPTRAGTPCWSRATRPRRVSGLQAGNARRHGPHRLRRAFLQSRPQGQGRAALFDRRRQDLADRLEGRRIPESKPALGSDPLPDRRTAPGNPLGAGQVPARKWGLYALRAEANYVPGSTAFRPLEVAFRWTERHGDTWGKGLVTRSHTQLVDRLPARYTIHVAATTGRTLNRCEVRLQGDHCPARRVWLCGRPSDVGGGKFVGRWVTYGRNLATGKSYTASVALGDRLQRRAVDGKTLTDGIVGPCWLWSWAAGNLWKPDTNPTITLDLGGPTAAARPSASTSWTWATCSRTTWPRRTKIRVLVSDDGKNYRPLGRMNSAALEGHARSTGWPRTTSRSAPISFFLLPDSSGDGPLRALRSHQPELLLLHGVARAGSVEVRAFRSPPYAAG